VAAWAAVPAVALVAEPGVGEVAVGAAAIAEPCA